MSEPTAIQPRAKPRVANLEKFSDIRYILDLYTIKNLRLIAEKLNLNLLYGKRVNPVQKPADDASDQRVQLTKQQTSITQLSKTDLISEIANYYSIKMIQGELTEEMKKIMDDNKWEEINKNDLFTHFSLEDLRELIKATKTDMKVKGVAAEQLRTSLKPLFTFYLIPNFQNLDQKDLTISEKIKNEDISISDEDKKIIVDWVKTSFSLMDDDGVKKSDIIESIKKNLYSAYDTVNTSGYIGKTNKIEDLIIDKYNTVRREEKEKMFAKNKIDEIKLEKLALAETKRYMKTIIRELPKIINIKEIRQYFLDTSAENTGDLLGYNISLRSNKFEPENRPGRKTKEQLQAEFMKKQEEGIIIAPKAPRGRPKKEVELVIEKPKKVKKELSLKTYLDLIDFMYVAFKKYNRGDLMGIKIPNPTTKPNFYKTLDEFKSYYYPAVSDESNTDMREELKMYYNENYANDDSIDKIISFLSFGTRLIDKIPREQEEKLKEIITQKELKKSERQESKMELERAKTERRIAREEKRKEKERTA
jgi:hypothetical protein